ncbi:MAG: hypothetical protein GF328_13620, partial [Candidatus Latescibacteria bacterium]|nr:hypothetical protein [Candidatus Latescibacterota bacterium]
MPPLPVLCERTTLAPERAGLDRVLRRRRFLRSGFLALERGDPIDRLLDGSGRTAGGPFALLPVLLPTPAGSAGPPSLFGDLGSPALGRLRIRPSPPILDLFALFPRFATLPGLGRTGPALLTLRGTPAAAPPGAFAARSILVVLSRPLGRGGFGSGAAPASLGPFLRIPTARASQRILDRGRGGRVDLFVHVPRGTAVARSLAVGLRIGRIAVPRISADDDSQV